MRICILAPEFIPVWGGAGTYTQELVRHLPKEHELHVVAPKRKSFGSQAIETSEDDLELGDNVHVHYISNASDTVTYNAEFQYACLRHVPRILKNEQIELIQSHMSHMPDLLLRLRERVPTVVTLHNTIRVQRYAITMSHQPFDALEKSERKVLTLYPLLSVLEKLYLYDTRLCIAPSMWMKREAIRLSSISEERADSISVIPNSIDVKECKKIAERGKERFFLPERYENRRIILYCGRLLANKGLGVLVDAIPRILRSIDDDFLFVFAGPGDPHVYSARLRSLGVPADRFLFAGPLSRKKCLELMGCTETLILPSFLENCPYVVLEAMACGVPVVASNVGGIPEIIKDDNYGLTFTSGSSIELSRKVIELLQDKSLRRKLSQNSLQLVADRFSWASNLKMQMHAYESLLS
ncbi:MAG: glycosyltransferase family 4 protein [Candidatus Bathyarchaeia archaeon]|jgi:glycosyltransferase involved in cell wall biosynthesis